MRLFKSVGKVIPAAAGVGVGAAMLMARSILAAGNTNSTVGEELDNGAPSMSPWQSWVVCGVVVLVVACVYRYRGAVAVQQLELDQMQERRLSIV